MPSRETEGIREGRFAIFIIFCDTATLTLSGYFREKCEASCEVREIQAIRYIGEGTIYSDGCVWTE